MDLIRTAALVLTLSACSSTTHEVSRYEHELQFGLYAPELIRPQEPKAAIVTLLLASGQSARFTDAILHREGGVVWVDTGVGSPILGKWVVDDVRAALVVEVSGE